MGVALRVLIVEDSEDDVLLLVRTLRHSGYDLTYERVDTAAAMNAALDKQPWDIIIADYSMPEFSGLEALAVMNERGLDLPFIIVSGSIGEDVAVVAMKAGAHDYIIKGNLTRLIPAVERELRESEVRRARNQAEETLRLLESGVQHVEDAIVITTADFAPPGPRIVYVNAAFIKMTGYTREEVIGNALALLRGSKAEQSLREDLQAKLSKGEAVSREMTNYRKDGSEFISEWHIAPMRDQQGDITHLVSVQHDITERRRAEAELQQQREALHQSEKLATMGQLLAGVAHELNNPLSVVMGQAALLQQSIRGKRQIERADKIVQAAERCARIVNNFLALARQRPPERHPVHLNQVVREAVELLAYPLRVDSVEVRFELAEELSMLRADAHQLHQVVVNLVANAHQAMRETPLPRRLTLATGVTAGGGRLWLEVCDTGPGIAPEVCARIFEPFFTTKPPGVGTGLGLSLCQGIVAAHGGAISVVPREESGAVFRVELPVQAPEAAEVQVSQGIVQPMVRGKRILVVDDEPGISGVLAEVLQLDGHVVETVANGEAALAKLQEQPYDVIVSDIRMPELDGPGLYWEMERRDPSLLQRVVFLTGDTLSAGTREFLEQTGVPCLSKPFALSDVREIVQRILQAQEAHMAEENSGGAAPQTPDYPYNKQPVVRTPNPPLHVPTPC
jgi:PAS domain S-box-containing protein